MQFARWNRSRQSCGSPSAGNGVPVTTVFRREVDACRAGRPAWLLGCWCWCWWLARDLLGAEVLGDSTMGAFAWLALACLGSVAGVRREQMNREWGGSGSSAAGIAAKCRGKRRRGRRAQGYGDTGLDCTLPGANPVGRGCSWWEMDGRRKLAWLFWLGLSLALFGADSGLARQSAGRKHRYLRRSFFRLCNALRVLCDMVAGGSN